MPANTQLMTYSLVRSNNSNGGNTTLDTSPNTPDMHIVTTNTATTGFASFAQNCVSQNPGPIWSVTANGFVGFLPVEFKINNPPWVPWWAYTFTGLRYVQTPTTPFIVSYPKAP